MRKDGNKRFGANRMILLKNGRIYPISQPAFQGDVLIRDGKIAALGKNIEASDATFIDASGCTITPGFIDAHCHIGMWEDGMGDEGADGNETSDPITPQMRAIDGLNPFDPCFHEACAAGITTVVTGPGSANVIGGQFAALKTHGTSVENMLVKAPVAMKAAMGENPKQVYGTQKVTPYTRMAIAALFRKAMFDAQEYAAEKKKAESDPDKKPDMDMAMEALLPVLSGELLLKVHAHRADDILTALRIAREFHLRISLEHCTEGHLIVNELKSQIDALGGVPVILGPLLSERSKVELRNLTFRAPAILKRAGIEFALMTDHPVIPIQYLPICAALAVREGLDEETALASITLHAARAVGLDGQIGSLDVGKDSDLAMFSGHPFDFRARCTMTMINGQIVYREERESER